MPISLTMFGKSAKDSEEGINTKASKNL